MAQALTYNVSTYSDVLEVMPRNIPLDGIVLEGAPDAPDLPCIAKIYGTTGWFEIQFKDPKTGNVYLFNSVDQKWGYNAPYVAPIYGDDYDGSVEINPLDGTDDGSGSSDAPGKPVDLDLAGDGK